MEDGGRRQRIEDRKNQSSTFYPQKPTFYCLSSIVKLGIEVCLEIRTVRSIRSI